MKHTPILIKIVEELKKIFKCRTYHVEYAFVLITLLFVGTISGKGPIEWLGVLAVFFTFCHTSIASRLEEREEHRKKITNLADVHCYYKLNYYFYAKELCWFLYFLIFGAYSALAGVLIFLLYTPWRKYWRKYHPIQGEALASDIKK